MPNMGPLLLSAADRAARRFGVGLEPFDAAELIAQAERKNGRVFRSRDFEPALVALLKSLEEEAELSVFGRFSLKWDVLRLLGNVLRFEAAEAENPEIVQAEVPAPIFITGLPRSGTTFLHMLLAQDPKNRIPRSWQTIHPYPEARDHAKDRRVERVEWQLRAFRRLAPDVGDLHPVAATTPQECTEITAHTFQSLRFDNTYFIPSYLRWLEARGHAMAFAFHRRFLQHLQAQAPGGQWVLKCPDHVFTLDAIVQAYPDARFVFVHRDPTAVLPSVAKLTEVLRAPFTRRLDRVAIGAEVSNRWEQGAGKIMRAADALPRQRVLHLHYDEITRAPLPTLQRLYSYFDLPFTTEAQAAVAGFVERRPRGGYGVNLYDPAEFGLELGRLRERFSGYIGAFADLAPRPALV
jgi:hypothetical protein